MTTIDVVIPSYNYGHYLTECVESVVSQEGVESRALILDDCSSDDTAQVAERLVARFKNVEYRRHAVNCGHIATYNEGLLGWASAQYSLLLSADDYLAPGALGRACALLDENPTVGFSFGKAVLIEGHRPAPPASYDDAPRTVSSRSFMHTVCTVGNFVPTATAVVRTRLQHELGGYRAELPHSGDMEMWLRFAANGDVGVHSSVQAFRRIHAKNMYRDYNSGAIGDRRELLAAVRTALADWGTQIPELEAWAAETSHNLATQALWIACQALDDGRVDIATAAIEAAEEMCPGTTNESSWWRLKIRQVLGPKVWPRIASLKGSKAIVSTQGGEVHGREVGWWPENALG